MKKQLGCVLGAVLCLPTAWAQNSAAPTQPLQAALTALPQQVSTHTVDLLAFTNSIEAAVHDSDLSLAGIVPLLKTALQSQDTEERRLALLTASQLARRPNSIVELKSLLPTIESHFNETSIYLRTGAMLTFVNLQPSPQDQSVQALAHALDTTGTADDFGVYLCESLVRLKPADSAVQSAISGYLGRPGLPQSRRASAIEAIGVPNLGDRLTAIIIETAKTTPAGRLQNAAIISCAKIGPRAVTSIRDTLDSIQHNNAASSDARQAARQALQTITQQ